MEVIPTRQNIRTLALLGKSLLVQGGNRMRRIIFIFAVAIFYGFSFQANPLLAGNPPSIYFVDESKLSFDALPGTDTSRYWGVHKGAGYRVEVPDNWNGDLVLYCHGYRGYVPELTVSNPSIRAYLVQNGYAWAASSYSTNGYDVKTGVQDTNALAKYFNGLVGKPKRVYIMGHSMGGHVTGVAIEQYPNLFAGALPMCGVMGDCELFDFFFDYQVLAQYFTGTMVNFPWPEDYETVIIPEMKMELGAAFPYALNSAGDFLKIATKYRSGGQRPLFDVAFVSWANFLFGQGLDGTIGIATGNVMGNMDTVYQLDGVPALSPEEEAINEGILRVQPDPQGRHPNGLANIPPISGNIQIPVLTLHTLGDLFVPFSMEEIYAERVAARGKSDLLVQRAIRDVGHCGFTTLEQEIAFADLVNWVENGVRPAGDDVLDPIAVANPDFGCQFTTDNRSYAPPCP
jgi:pimeloyl-ACP methyl ester carboxylesterase